MGLWEALAEYTPALAGSVPLDIDLEDSDLDVICEAHDFAAFIRDLREMYGERSSFGVSREVEQGVETVFAWFTHDGWGVELFAQPVPVAQQYACLHLLVEARLLEIGGKPSRDAI